jgi:hypothetical protein
MVDSSGHTQSASTLNSTSELRCPAQLVVNTKENVHKHGREGEQWKEKSGILENTHRLRKKNQQRRGHMSNGALKAKKGCFKEKGSPRWEWKREPNVQKMNVGKRSARQGEKSPLTGISCQERIIFCIVWCKQHIERGEEKEST